MCIVFECWMNLFYNVNGLQLLSSCGVKNTFPIKYAIKERAVEVRAAWCVEVVVEIFTVRVGR